MDISLDTSRKRWIALKSKNLAIDARSSSLEMMMTGSCGGIFFWGVEEETFSCNGFVCRYFYIIESNFMAFLFDESPLHTKTSIFFQMYSE